MTIQTIEWDIGRPQSAFKKIVSALQSMTSASAKDSPEMQSDTSKK